MKRLSSFFRHDSSPGILLAVAAVFAMVLANTAGNVYYQKILEIPVSISFGSFEIAKPLLLWVNDGLMALFFLLVGLEIKRELLVGHLSSKEQIVLPAIAAVAGIIFPALVFAWFNSSDPIAIRGWAIPSATDIAFALGVFTLFGTRLPVTLKLFLLSVAIFDDIGAIVIIAIFYSQDLSTLSLSVAGFGLLGLFVLNRCGVNRLTPYMLIGAIVWTAVLKSGVHATLAGFLIAWFVPLNIRNKAGEPMLPSLEHGLHPWVAFLILPVFAFANAGVSFQFATFETVFNPISLGIAFGLFVGKQIGVFGVSWLAIQTGFVHLPKGATWWQLYGVSLLCGIGFTMSLFIGTLAFEEQGLAYQTSVKVGVIMGSLLSALLAAVVIAKAGADEREPISIRHARTV